MLGAHHLSSLKTGEEGKSHPDTDLRSGRAQPGAHTVKINFLSRGLHRTDGLR